MQYSVTDKEGSVYGPVDLQTLRSWVLDGKIFPDTQITDNLSNVTLAAS